MNCGASIIRCQYVTFKTNNDAFEEYLGHLATKFPKEFPDAHAFNAEREVFKSFFNSLTEEIPAEKSKTIECAAKNCSDSFHKQHLFLLSIRYLIYFGLKHLLSAKTRDLSVD